LEQFQRDGLRYLVQEYIPGENLATVLADKGSFTAAEVWQVLATLLPGIEWLHGHGLIHGDIKPENIVCRESMNPALPPDNLADLVLVDIGAATIAGELAGIPAGSPAYAAPEQLKGVPVFASDLYSLGVTAIHLLTGIHPFNLVDFVTHQWAWRSYWSPDTGNSQERLEQQRLADFLDRLIQPNFQERIGSAAEAMAELQKHHIFSKKVSESRVVAKTEPCPAPIWECIATLAGHQGLFANINAIAISPDGTLLASGSDDKTIRLWNLQTGEELFALGGYNAVKSVAFHPHTSTILASGSRLRPGDRSPSGVTPSPENCTIHLWNLLTRSLIKTLNGHQQTVNTVQFSSDGILLASGSADKTVQVWQVETGELLACLKGHTLAVTAVAFSPRFSWGGAARTPDEKHQSILVSVSADASVRLWDLATLQPMHTLTEHTAAVRVVAFSPDGNWLATAGEDRTIRLWDCSSWQCVRTFSGHPWIVSALAFSADGETLISGSWDKTVKLWQVSSGREVATLVGHTDAVSDVVFSPHLPTIASASYDRTIRLWRK
jgi:WD40 repeat protein